MSILISIIAASGFTLFAQAPDPVASFSPGAASGVELLKNPDGEWVQTEVGGRLAVQTVQSMPGALYFYFKLDEEARKAIHGECWIYLEYFDSGFGSMPLQYNSGGNPYRDSSPLLFLNSQTWTNALVHFPDTQFQCLQNAGADFRIPWSGPLSLSKVELFTTKPEKDIQAPAERVRCVFSIAYNDFCKSGTSKKGHRLV